jgi:hypothetical protein
MVSITAADLGDRRPIVPKNLGAFADDLAFTDRESQQQGPKEEWRSFWLQISNYSRDGLKF